MKPAESGPVGAGHPDRHYPQFEPTSEGYENGLSHKEIAQRLARIVMDWDPAVGPEFCGAVNMCDHIRLAFAAFEDEDPGGEVSVARSVMCVPCQAGDHGHCTKAPIGPIAPGCCDDLGAVPPPGGVLDA